MEFLELALIGIWTIGTGFGIVALVALTITCFLDLITRGLHKEPARTQAIKAVYKKVFIVLGASVAMMLLSYGIEYIVVQGARVVATDVLFGSK